MDEQNDHVVRLQDDEGNDVDFEHLMTLKHEGNDYVMLEAVQDMEDCMEGEVIILKIVQDEAGEDVYATIEDEAELQAVFDKCIAAIEEQDAMEEDADDDEDWDDSEE